MLEIARTPSDAERGAASLRELLAFERLLSDLSARFLSLPAAEIDPALDDGLRRIAETLEVDRVALSEVDRATGRAKPTHAYAAPGVEVAAGQLPLLPGAPWTHVSEPGGRVVAFSRSDEPAPDPASTDGVAQAGSRPDITIPLVVAGETVGALNVGALRAERQWSAELIARLELLGQIFANALVRRRAQADLDAALGFERLATRVLSSLLLAPSYEEAAVTDGTLREIADFLGVDRAGIWDRTPEGADRVAGALRTLRLWVDPAAPGATARLGLHNVPWIGARLAQGEIVRLSRLADLPAAAEADHRMLRSIGVRSFMAAPIISAGAVVGALSISTVRQDRAWTDALVSGLRLLAEAFASLHARRLAERDMRAAEAEAAEWRERLAHVVRVHTVGEMSAALAHELRQPLGAIENYALAAQRRALAPSPDVAKIAELLEKVVGQTTRAGDVLSRVRGLVKRHDVRLAVLDIEQAIGTCLEIVRADCESRGIAVDRRRAHGLPRVLADDIHVQQVMLNLLRNAMDAVCELPPSASRSITVETAALDADTVCVRVSDRGPGIPESDFERVFESFYSTKSDGLGIGLAICRKLIEAQGGTLRASCNPGGGALFAFTLPVAPADA
jgi:signal transduction histidine kinase